jgi:hypothetical protein
MLLQGYPLELLGWTELDAIVPGRKLLENEK